GTGYWIGRNVKPELFDLKGNIIPKINYGYKEIIINLSLIEYFNKLPNFQQIGIVKKYNASMFQKDLLRQQELMQPVWFSHLA
ncbi:hypothetical protein, partial [Vibrio parahaemolyticus]|uniref:hypothetical protein n=1 Tax=Vibrio parahaemolyticus TaxID=670 RepID=UPI001A8C617F